MKKPIKGSRFNKWLFDYFKCFENRGYIYQKLMF